MSENRGQEVTLIANQRYDRRHVYFCVPGFGLVGPLHESEWLGDDGHPRGGWWDEHDNCLADRRFLPFTDAIANLWGCTRWDVLDRRYVACGRFRFDDGVEQERT